MRLHTWVPSYVVARQPAGEPDCGRQHATPRRRIVYPDGRRVRRNVTEFAPDLLKEPDVRRIDAAQTKGKHARNVFLNEKLGREIGLYLKRIEVKDDGQALFRTQKRAAFSANTLCQTMNAIYRRAGIEGATSHSGRRSFITTLAGKGIGVRVLASLAGHRSIATTQAYIDVNDEMKRAAVELV